ncbi:MULTISPECIES: helix-turn-helix domain-containing protein [Nocardiopsis]|nr:MULTISPECIES: helix-turn-helix transcriptional regulator [Nocardiopsis]
MRSCTVIDANEVRRARRRAKLSRRELAEMAGVHPLTVAKLEQGVTVRPPSSQLVRLARALNTTVETLDDGR